MLSQVGTQFEQLLNDLFKARNEFLADALFMKRGRLGRSLRRVLSE